MDFDFNMLRKKNAARTNRFFNSGRLADSPQKASNQQDPRLKSCPPSLRWFAVWLPDVHRRDQPAFDAI
jgi:hypothetical protein